MAKTPPEPWEPPELDVDAPEDTPHGLPGPSSPVARLRLARELLAGFVVPDGGMNNIAAGMVVVLDGLIVLVERLDGEGG